MPEEHVEGLVLRDAAGNLYVIPSEVVEQGRVHEESRAKVEAALDDTTGFVFDSAALASSTSFQVLGPVRLPIGTSSSGPFPIPPAGPRRA
jgi:hypothetical protein